MNDLHKRDKVPDSYAANVCERCGQDGADSYGGTWLCQACFMLRGSCCQEFGGDDLWEAGQNAEGSNPDNLRDSP